jgi:eukaryotic-like serine/threonine-protein kinase
MSDGAAREISSDGSRIGQVVLERYEITRELASGGMGNVYEARHRRIGRRFAVKFLRADLGSDKKTLARFEQEAITAGGLENDNICAIVDVGTAPDGAPCLVMEYLDGENLADLLEAEGALPIPRAVEIVRQVCRGLSVAHRQHVIHRDLKPRNLIVCRLSDGSDLVKIVDFGIAKLRGPRTGEGTNTTTGATLGTPHYMAPEQARGEKTLDERTDIYALGVILYELLTGEKPHPGDSYNAIIYHILSKDPVPVAELREEVPEGLAAIVHRAMGLEPATRFSTAQELERALRPYSPGADPGLAPEAATQRAIAADADSTGFSGVRTARRRSFVPLLTFASGGLLGIVAGVLVSPGRAVNEPAAPSAAPEIARLEPAPLAGASASGTEQSSVPKPPVSVAPAVESAPAARKSSPRVGVRPPPDKSRPAPKGQGFDYNNPYQ